MALSAEYKENMKEVASWLSENPNVDIEYDFFSIIDEEDPSNLDNHKFGDPIGWAAAILGRQGGVSFVEFAQNELGIDTGGRVWYFLTEWMIDENGDLIQLPDSLTVAEFVAMQFDWIGDGKSIDEFLEELDK